MGRVGEEQWVSRLDLPETSDYNMHFPLDVMRCTICSQAFYVKCHGAHPCFLKDTTKQKGPDAKASVMVKERTGAACASKGLGRAEDSSDTASAHSQHSLYLKALVSTRPVVCKIWRPSYALCRTARKRGACSGSMEKHTRPLVRDLKTMETDPSWTRP